MEINYRAGSEELKNAYLAYREQANPADTLSVVNFAAGFNAALALIQSKAKPVVNNSFSTPNDPFLERFVFLGHTPDWTKFAELMQKCHETVYKPVPEEEEMSWEDYDKKYYIHYDEDSSQAR